MDKPDFSAVTKILTCGSWIEIKKGSLEGAGGVQHVSMGVVEPLYRFTLPDGVSGVILARCLDGWAPLVVEGAPDRLEDMSEYRQPAGVPGIRDMTPAGLNRP